MTALAAVGWFLFGLSFICWRIDRYGILKEFRASSDRWYACCRTILTDCDVREAGWRAHCEELKRALRAQQDDEPWKRN